MVEIKLVSAIDQGEVELTIEEVRTLNVARNIMSGNIVDDIVLGSIEFGVKYLEAPLIIVLGHERCGAVTAAVDATLHNSNECSIHIQNIINMIQPTVHAVIKNMTLNQPISTQQKNQKPIISTKLNI